MRKLTKFNQWKNSSDVIEWFNRIENKDRSTFLQYDIDQFYPSIKEDLLNLALDWASGFVAISDQERKIIMATKKNLLYSEGVPWIKKGDGNCDVTMGSWDGAEVCDLIGLYALSKCQSENLGLNLGLYRDDGL